MVSKLPSDGSKAMFVELIVEGSTPTTPITEPQLRAWVNGLKVPYTTAIDVDPSTFAIKKSYGIKETAYVIERDTRKILAKTKTIEDGLTALEAQP